MVPAITTKKNCKGFHSVSLRIKHTRTNLFLNLFFNFNKKLFPCKDVKKTVLGYRTKRVDG
jgi:hypothetical protein